MDIVPASEFTAAKLFEFGAAKKFLYLWLNWATYLIPQNVEEDKEWVETRDYKK